MALWIYYKANNNRIWSIFTALRGMEMGRLSQLSETALSHPGVTKEAPWRSCHNRNFLSGYVKIAIENGHL